MKHLANTSGGERHSSKARPALVIASRELGAYFASPVMYIVGALFLLFSGFLFFSGFFLYNRAEMRSFFSQLPVLFSFFIPALTMRLFADEFKSTSYETLATLPVTPAEIALGKFLAGWCSSCALLVPTLLYALAISFFGQLDLGPVIAGYIGAVLLCGAFSAIGVFASSITKNQIIAFFTGFALCIVLSLIDQASVFLPSLFADAAAFLSASRHFTSISRGIIDSRDIIYFLSLGGLFFAMTARSLSVRRAR